MIGNNLPGIIYLDPGELGIDIIVSTNDLIGFEVKMARPFKGNIDVSPLFQGIGQAIWYLRRGMDYSYLVVPLLADLPYFTEVFSNATKYLGLIVFDKNLEFQRIREAEKSPSLDYSTREVVLELLAKHRSVQTNLALRKTKEKWRSSSQ
jgi:hypothetical protein